MQTPQVIILLSLSVFLVSFPVPTDKKRFFYFVLFCFFLRNHNIIIVCFLIVGNEAQVTQRWF
jgi:hypothetical protein